MATTTTACTDREAAAWTLRYARRMLSKTVGAPIDGVVVESDDAFVGVVDTVRKGEYDEIMLSLREHRPRRGWRHRHPIEVKRP